MAEEAVYKQKFNIRDVATRSVTLYPTRAQVVRDINDITLNPGTNEITVFGLTPTADESSIKVDGKGSATITDMSIELVPNQENFDDVYLSDSDDEDVDEWDEDQDGPTTDQIKALEQKAHKLVDEIDRINEEKRSATSQMTILKHYGDSMEKDRPDDLSNFLTAYATERKKIQDIIFTTDSRLRVLNRQKRSVDRELTKAKKILHKSGLKAIKAKNKERKKNHRAQQEKEKAKRRLKEERAQFWPRKVYSIVVTLETNSFTPASSRRGSIDTVGKPTPEPVPSDGGDSITLSISYITSSACWAPRYDLSLTTTNNTGLIAYRAELCNTTSETWNNAKVILSTSQTAFQGLGDPIPTMESWHIKLAKKTKNNGDNLIGTLTSVQEDRLKQGNFHTSPNASSEPRAQLFGIGPVHGQMVPGGGYASGNYESSRLRGNIDYQQQVQQLQAQQQRRAQQAQMAQIAQTQQQQIQQGSMAASQPAPSHADDRSIGAARQRFSRPEGEVDGVADGDEIMDDSLFDNETTAMLPDLPALATQESTWSESGLTATYDIPGLRTIAPSHTTRRQKIASIHLKDVNLSYLIVPKLRAAAFLKARIYNTSSITLLRGPCGLTLDGSFLGNTTIPRCSAGDLFRLSLGVDPSVSILYSKPAMKRGQSGMFQKEGSGVYTRSVTITNTKSNRVLEGIVIDQIPVSDDERLRIDVQQPAALRGEGSSVATGEGLPAVGKVTEKWGKATAMWKKNGEFWWDVKIEPGRAVKLLLEYETRFPTTEVMVGV